MSPTAPGKTWRRLFSMHPGGCAKPARFRFAARLLLIAGVLLSGACRKRTASLPPPPRPPTPPNLLAQADTAYAARELTAAAEAYQNFLKASPQAPQRDRALFRIAMVCLAKDSPLYDAPRALDSLRQLTTTLPASPYAAEANLYLTLHEEVVAQQQTLEERSRKVAEITGELANLKSEDEMKAAELQQLKADTVRREERIKQVTAELERLKAIDMQRRPSVPKR